MKRKNVGFKIVVEDFSITITSTQSDNVRVAFDHLPVNKMTHKEISYLLINTFLNDDGIDLLNQINNMCLIFNRRLLPWFLKARGVKNYSKKRKKYNCEYCQIKVFLTVPQTEKGE